MAPKQPPPSADYLAFEKLRPELAQRFPGMFALMREGEFVGAFPTRHDAFAEGSRRWPLGPYAVAVIPPKPPAPRPAPNLHPDDYDLPGEVFGEDAF